MTAKSIWEHLAEELKKIRQSVEPLRADWFAYKGSEDHGIWLLRPDGPDADELRAAFSLIAARAIERLGIPPIPVPQPLQHFPAWRLYCDFEEEMALREGKTKD